MNTWEVAIATKRVLLIDNEAHVREVVKACLKDLGGWDVLSVTSAGEGFNQAVAVQPDAIILEISTPGMDGFGLLQKLKAHPVTQFIPVVLLTAKARWFSPQQLKQFGVVGAIAKPFHPLSLTKEIAQVLGWEV